MRATESARTNPIDERDTCMSTRICGRGSALTNMICETVPTLTPESRTGAPCTSPATSAKVACSITRCSNTCLDLPSSSTRERAEHQRADDEEADLDLEPTFFVHRHPLPA